MLSLLLLDGHLVRKGKWVALNMEVSISLVVSLELQVREASQCHLILLLRGGYFRSNQKCRPPDSGIVKKFNTGRFAWNVSYSEVNNGFFHTSLRTIPSWTGCYLPKNLFLFRVVHVCIFASKWCMNVSFCSHTCSGHCFLPGTSLCMSSAACWPAACVHFPMPPQSKHKSYSWILCSEFHYTVPGTSTKALKGTDDSTVVHAQAFILLHMKYLIYKILNFTGRPSLRS